MIHKTQSSQIDNRVMCHFPEGKCAHDNTRTIAVGMSGGVDSSVTAAILQEMGYSVIGLFMKNWEEKDEAGLCTTEADASDVARVCDTLHIPHYTVNFAKEYKEHVFAEFLAQLKRGKTPNPDILCNREIKFKLLLDHALKLGADALATGHYAQNISRDGQHMLLRSVDTGKDQTYFLYTISQYALQRVLFPIGAMQKSEVRSLAKKHGLHTASKKDSTGICFIGERNFRAFLQNYLPYQPGNFETLDGTVVGRHIGVAYYTNGQRRGLGLGGEGEPWFVIDKRIHDNVVVVERGLHHPALYASALIAKEPHWIGGAPPQLPLSCSAKIRYRQQDAPCVVAQAPNGCLLVHFETPMRAITPEQAIVFYQGAACLGGATIDCQTHLPA